MNFKISFKTWLKVAKEEIEAEKKMNDEYKHNW